MRTMSAIGFKGIAAHAACVNVSDTVGTFLLQLLRDVIKM